MCKSSLVFLFFESHWQNLTHFAD